MSVTLLNETYNPIYPYDYDLTNAIGDATIGGGWGDWNNDSIALYSYGCLTDENDYDSKPDCYTACQNITQVWNSSLSGYTLHNCIVYPIVSQLWHQGNLTKESIAVAEYFGIQNNTESPLYTTTPVIDTCIHDYCVGFESENEFCKSPNGSYNLGLTNWTLTYPTDICNNLNAAINGDLMGIGVAISLMMQISLLTLAWILFHVSWDFISFLTYFSRRKSGQPSALQARLRNSKPAKALIDWEGLEEFQKTQVWLMIAIQIACLVALNKPDIFEASSWQQFRNNIGVMYDISFGGILPVLLSIILLRHAEKVDWQQLLTGTISVSLASAVWMITRNQIPYFDPETVTHEGPASCARTAPTALCFPNDWFSGSSAAGGKRGLAELIICWIILFFLLVENLRVFREKEGRDTGRKRNIWELNKSWLAHQSRSFQSKHPSLSSDGPNPLLRSTSGLLYSNNFWKLTSRVIILVVECLILALSLRLFHDYSKIFGNTGFTVIDRSKWSLGQVIAVTAFVPPMVMFAWDCIFGKKEESEGREELHGASRTRSSNDSVDKTHEDVTQVSLGSVPTSYQAHGYQYESLEPRV